MLGEASTIQPTDPTRLSLPFSNDGDAARSGDIGDSEETWIEATVAGSGTVTFDYQVSADSGDNFTFYIDGSYTFGRSGSKSWAASGPWTVSGSGTHKLRWRFSKDSSGSSGDDCAWVDHIRWTGDAPESGATWSQIEYTYDPSGRRIAKDVDGVVTKYLYDGSHCIAEYDANDVLLRKYIYGPGVDQPICMIDVADANAAYYYHYDALGSVVALSDSAGDTVQLYEYDVYGQVASYPPDDTNPFLFTGRRYDTETGLYYYRARYYNPTIGRFLQTDPIGYEGGMNMYAYCSNNPAGFADPSGMTRTLLGYSVSKAPGGGIVTTWHWYNDDVPEGCENYYDSARFDRTWTEWIMAMAVDMEWMGEVGFFDLFSDPVWDLLRSDTGSDRLAFWTIKAMKHLGLYAGEGLPKSVWIQTHFYLPVIGGFKYSDTVDRVRWGFVGTMTRAEMEKEPWGMYVTPIAAMAHELEHARLCELDTPNVRPGFMREVQEAHAIAAQNAAMAAERSWNPVFYDEMLGWKTGDWIMPNPDADMVHLP